MRQGKILGISQQAYIPACIEISRSCPILAKFFPAYVKTNAIGKQVGMRASCRALYTCTHQANGTDVLHRLGHRRYLVQYSPFAANPDEVWRYWNPTTSNLIGPYEFLKEENLKF